MTGHAGQIFKYQQLPEELASWMVEEGGLVLRQLHASLTLCSVSSPERSPECKIYRPTQGEQTWSGRSDPSLTCLSQMYPEHLRSILTKAKMNSLFASMGASMERISLLDEIQPSFQPPNSELHTGVLRIALTKLGPKRPLPHPLKNLVKLVKHATEQWVHETTRKSPR